MNILTVFEVLLPIAIILVLSKLLQMGSKKAHLPQVVGMLVAGIVIGLIGMIPVVGKDYILTDNGRNGIKFLAEIGVVLIMFSAGLETNMDTIKKSGVSAIIVTLLGVIVPMALGFLVAGLFHDFTGTYYYCKDCGEIIKNATCEEGHNVIEIDQIWSNMFYGVILTATSVSVTVATLKEMGRLNGKAGTIITCAAILDDIIGVVVLSIILSLSGASGGESESTKTLGELLIFNHDNLSILATVINVILFFILIIFAGIGMRKFFKLLNKKESHKRRVPIFALAYCFAMAWASEKLFGVADITGAFFAGLALSGIGHHINPIRDALADDTTDYIERKSDVLSYMLFTPIFFANVGINMNFSNFDPELIGFGVCFIIAGLAGKVLGCGLGAKVTKNSWIDSARIGVGMMARAEVALICATKGMNAGLVNSGMSVFIVIMIIVSSFVTPLVLKFTYKNAEPVKTDYTAETFTAIHEPANVEETPTNNYNSEDVEP